MLDKLLNLLATSDQKQIIGLALVPGVGLEAAVYDVQRGIILNYGRKEVAYNFSTREVQDYVEFKTALVSLIQELEIPPKSFVYMVLPNAYFDFIEVPEAVGSDELRMALLSKAEEFYLFKKAEPILGYSQILNIKADSQRRYAYSAFQSNTVDELKDIISDVGLQLIGIETSYSAILRGLCLTGMPKDVIEQDAAWAVMLVGSNSFTIFQMNGRNLFDYAEVPIAVKSLSQEEAYQAIVSSSSQLLQSFSSTRLYVVSQTDAVSAEVLERQLFYDYEIVSIDTNRYSKKPIIEIESSSEYQKNNSLTLSVIGAAGPKDDFSLQLNILKEDPSANMGIYYSFNLLGRRVDITDNFVKNLCILITILAILIFGSLIIVCIACSSRLNESVSIYSSKVTELEVQIKQEETVEVKEEVNINNLIDHIANLNVSANSFYDSISTDIPKNVWLVRYFNQDGDKIAIQGIAENIVDIYEYYKNLKIVAPQSDIKLTELRVVTEEDSKDESSFLNDLSVNYDKDRLYSFEISNTDVNFNQQAGDLYENPVAETDIIIKSKEDGVQRPVENTSRMRPAR